MRVWNKAAAGNGRLCTEQAKHATFFRRGSLCRLLQMLHMSTPTQVF